jgi:prepilin-type cleavage/methylation N-terminal domain protein
VDLANVRSAYAQVSTEALLGNTGVPVTVKLKQKQAGWQSADPVNIGGIVHSNGDKDTDNWKGDAAPDGSCVVSYDETHGVVLTWSGTAAPGNPSYPFDTKHTEFFGEVLYKTEFWTRGDMNNNPNFEFDSRCPDSIYIPQIKKALEESTSNSLLQQKDCTWAFLGDGHEGQEADRYLFWTSLDTSKVGPGAKIPVLIQTGDGKYYVSETTTEQRENKRGEPYVTVSKHLNTKAQYKEVLDAGKEYFTLKEAYDAYVVALADPKYDAVRATQTSAP